MSSEDENTLFVPKLFISYSWTNQDHIDWVLQLATDLRSQGIETILDRWHLKEGQDAHSFMEQMVRDEDIGKVVLVCDEKYVDRANKREGGVGAESQIITSKIYGDVGQTKFVALATAEDDNGDLLLPNFFTTRIAIDFRDADQYAEKLEQLIRWAFDKPLLAVPAVGSRPKFLDDQTSFQPTSLLLRRKPHSSGPSQPGAFLEYWTELRENHSDFTLDLRDVEDADELVVETIESLGPLLSQIIVSVRDRVTIDEIDSIEAQAIVDYFQKVLANYRMGNTNWGADVTKFFGVFAFAAVIGILLRFQRFGSLKHILETPVLVMEADEVTARATSITRLNTVLHSLGHRNARLKLNRASLSADLSKEMCDRLPIEFWEFLQADFYLFLYFDRLENDAYGARWWPNSNIYATDRDGAFPIFARAVQTSLRDELLRSISLNGAERLRAFKDELGKEPYTSMRWRSMFSEFPIWRLGNFEAILETYR